MKPKIETLEAKLSGRKEECRKEAKNCARWANLLYFGVVLSSAAATIAAAVQAPRLAVAVIAALPGAFTLGITAFKPDAKSQWWWAKWSMLEGVTGSLRYEGKSESDAHKEWNAFIRGHESKHPGWGSPPPGAIK
jgi:hypothetical protein